jgi:hypothetical protein
VDFPFLARSISLPVREQACQLVLRPPPAPVFVLLCYRSVFPVEAFVAAGPALLELDPSFELWSRSRLFVFGPGLCFVSRAIRAANQIIAGKWVLSHRI